MGERWSDEDMRLVREWLAELPEPVARPALIIVCGLPGTGKSYFSRKLGERVSAVIVESDALRKLLFPSPSYDAPENYRVFRICHLLIEELLRKGIQVILDATNLVEHHRERLYSIAERLGAKLIIVRAEAPPELVQQRLQARIGGGSDESRSDADWKVYQKMRPRVERIQRNHFVVDTSRDITPVIEKILKEVKR